MKPIARILPLLLALRLAAQQPAPPDPWQSLAFLQGAWQASTTTAGSSQAKVIGAYTFRPELQNHILARHTISTEACQGPATFDCDHSDLLYLYQDAPGQPLKAIYFDNEGHVIHYSVSTPSPTSAVFLSDPSQPGPQFQLRYDLKANILSGKFQMRLPGHTEWTSYLEWSGPKK